MDYHYITPLDLKNICGNLTPADYVLDIGRGSAPGDDDWLFTVSQENQKCYNDEKIGELNTDLLTPGRYTLRLRVTYPGSETVYEDRKQLDITYALMQIYQNSTFTQDNIKITGFAFAPKGKFGYYQIEYRLSNTDPWTILTPKFNEPIDYNEGLGSNHSDINFFPVIAENLSIKSIPEGDVTLRLAVYDNAGTLFDEDQVTIKNHNYNMQSGWPRKAPGIPYMGRPAIGDMNGDGSQEIAVISRKLNPDGSLADILSLSLFQASGDMVPGES